MASKASVVEDLLTLPALGALDRPRPDESVSAADIQDRLAGALAALRQVASAGTRVQATAAELLPGDDAERASSLSRSLGGDGAPRALSTTALSAFLYDQAVLAVAEARIEDAIVLLAAILDDPSTTGDAVLGLAVCAARLRKYDLAQALAMESLKLRPNHPRASCLAGLCALELGDRKSAQTHLAMTARVARNQPQFRDELRAAQRLLILMHIA